MTAVDSACKQPPWLPKGAPAKRAELSVDILSLGFLGSTIPRVYVITGAAWRKVYTEHAQR